MTAKVRAAVRDRAGCCCEYCRTQDAYCPDPFTIDHVIPQSKDGPSDLTNLAYACHGCNGSKHAATHHVDPATGQEAPLYNPRVDRWEQHFVWSADLMLALAISDVGRATVERLKLNRPQVQNLRGALIEIGRHPPSS